MIRRQVARLLVKAITVGADLRTGLSPRSAHQRALPGEPEDTRLQPIGASPDDVRQLFAALHYDVLGDEGKTALCQLLLRSQQTEQALYIAETILDASARAMALAAVAKAYSAGGDSDTARAILTQARRVTKEIGHSEMRHDILRDMSGTVENKLFGIRDKEQALAGLVEVAQLAARTERYGIDARTWPEEDDDDPVTRALQANFLFRSFTETMAKTKLDSDLKMKEFVQQAVTMAEALAKVKDTIGPPILMTLANRGAEGIADPPTRVEVLVDVAETQAQLGESAGARQALISALKDINLLVERRQRVAVLAHVAQVQTQLGDTTVARDAVADALMNVRSVNAVEAKVTALRTTAEVLARRGNHGSALATFGAARQIALSLDDRDKRVATLEAITKAQAQHIDIASALHAVNEIPNPEEQDALRQVVASVQAERQDVDGAIATLGEIQAPRERVWGFVAIAQAYAKAGDHVASRQAYADALQTVAEIVPSSDGIVLEEKPDLSEATESSTTLSPQLERTGFIAIIAEAQAKAGDLDGARNTFALASASVKAIPRRFEQVLALYGIANEQTRSGLHQAARDTVSVIMSTAKQLSVSYRQSSLELVADIQAQMGDIKAALATANKIVDPYYQSLALSTIAGKQAEAGEFDRALATMERISEGRTREDTLADIAIVKARAGDGTDAQADAQRIEDKKRRAKVLSAVALNLIGRGQGARAVEVAKQALRLDEGSSAVIADALLEADDRENLKQLVVVCTNNLGEAYGTCGLLAQAYPEQSSAIAHVLERFEADMATLPKA